MTKIVQCLCPILRLALSTRHRSHRNGSKRTKSRCTSPQTESTCLMTTCWRSRVTRTTAAGLGIRTRRMNSGGRGSTPHPQGKSASGTAETNLGSSGRRPPALKGRSKLLRWKWNPSKQVRKGGPNGEEQRKRSRLFIMGLK